MTDAGGHAAAAWHELLDHDLAAESMAWLDSEQRRRGLTFGERPLCTVIRPRFFTPSDYAALQRHSDILLGAFRTIGAIAREDTAFRAQFRLADWEESLLASAPPLHVLSPLSRIDAFLDPDTGNPWLTEYNGETPAGTAYCDVLSEIFQTIPVMRRFTERWQVRPLPGRPWLFNVLIDSWQRFSGRGGMPAIAIVDWDDVPTLAEFRLTQQYVEQFGGTCVVTTPDALAYDGSQLRTDTGVPIDLIYKRILLHELVAEEGLGHPMLRAVIDGNVCMVNPPSCKPLHKKASLAVLSDERNRARFTGAQQEAIARHIPWTRVVEERTTEHAGAPIDLVPWAAEHQDALVLKPNDDYGGAGIVLGWEVDPATWRAALAKALAEPYIVQQRIGLPREIFPAVHHGTLAFDERIVDTAPFCWHGTTTDGMLTRISTSTLVNVTAGGGSTVPTFVVERR